MSSEDESGSCLEDAASEGECSYSPDDETLYGAVENDSDFEVDASLYDTSTEPLATREEHANYLSVVAQRHEELGELTSRFAGDKSTELWVLRAVSYRQLVRLVWNYTGSSVRNPLPCCTYARIRKEFQSKEYVGFEEEEEDSD